MKWSQGKEELLRRQSVANWKSPRRSKSLQRRIITAMVLIGLLPLSLAFVITYLEERQAIRNAIGRDFRQIAIEAAGKVELQVMQGVSEARQLATIPILRGAVIDSNRSYVGRDHA